MKPDFALDLSEDGISLLHRAPNGAGWYREGRLEFAEGSIGKGLAAMRARAIELGGEDFQTKLILPRSQLLFTEIDKGVNVGEALSERTPYRADQLSFAVSEVGDKLKVVAVALETLGEAEGFINPHSLNPVGFTAIPKDGEFDGEPMLGGMLMGPDSFETDDQPVRIIEKPAFLPPPVPPVDLSEVSPAAAKPQEAPANPSGAPSSHDVPVPAPAPPSEAGPAKQTKPAPLVAAPAEPRGSQPAAFSSRRQGDDGTKDLTDTTSRIRRRTTRIVTRILDFDKLGKIGAGPAAEKAEATSKKSKDPPVARGGAKNTKKAAPKTEPATEPAVAGQRMVASRASASKPVPVVPPASAIKMGAPSAATPKPLSAAGSATHKRTEPPAAVAAQLAKVDPLAQLAKQQSRGKPRFLGLILTCILIVCLGLAALLSSFVLPDNAVGRLFSGGTEEQTDIAAGPESFDPALIEGPEADLPLLDETPFGEDAPFGAETELAALPIDDAIPDFARFKEEDLPPLAVPDETAAERPEVITEDEALAAYAATGIWQYSDTLRLTPSSSDTLDSLYVASLDPGILFEDAPALLPPAIDGGEAELAAFTPPPPPGVVFDFDERGLVRPTPEGALNPFGVAIFQGAPPIRAVPRPGAEVEESPDRIAPEARPERDVAESAPALDPDPTETLDPETLRLAAIRPAQRPGDLIETRERATLGGLTRAELAQLRPRVRPTSAQAQAEAIARALAEADAGNTEADLRAATVQAVSQSIRAPSRPRNFELVVARTRQSAPPAGSASTAGIQQASSARAAPEPRGSGPAVVRSSRAQPTGPVSSRVARAATDNNAIALGRVALVGVFGTSSNRSALVRMPNGRFKKVSVGDRVDGGRVAAISGNSLRYIKSGRAVTLEMPSS